MSWVTLTAFSASGWSAEGELTLRVVDEATGEPIAARVELTRPELVAADASRPAPRPTSRRNSLRVVRPLSARGTIPTTSGFVVDGQVRLNLKEGPYEFRVTHGPEYRVIRGNFTIEKTSEDEHVVALPRILDMHELGWNSLDAFSPDSRHDLSQRMRSEELDVAWTNAATEEVPDASEPVHADSVGDLIAYSLGEASGMSVPTTNDPTLAALTRLTDKTNAQRIAIANPFAWALPVYLASQKIDGNFVLGDWLRLDSPVLKPSVGRPFPTEHPRDNRSLGREAEQIYWEMLSAGFRIAPLAGTGIEAQDHPIGYNRTYVNREEASASLWDSVWQGNTFVTNGPLLQAELEDHPPGYVFELSEGDKVSLTPRVTLTVRDPVDYLEVIVNGMVHYTAKLDEFAKAGGRISSINVSQPGWALVRVVTLHEDHFRAAVSAPWYFEVGGQRRISKRSVEFFQRWLADFETELKSQREADLAAYAPYIRAARRFWQVQLEQANAR
ncbi:CehA/McbA family metallohydrolase domain-containing protein [Neorhodopirellula pilleata]|uniref:hypothetical protein n=1 Tax=Neorhodopirellula pilleata TaxID=2714738 RepID=UPI001E2F3BFB|nr:hypothetical protein [Neorhodopirellula pilleata]